MLETTRDHWLGDQTALEALIRFSDEELKHQELFRRIETMMADGMPEGYEFLPDPDPDMVAAAVLKNSTWAVLALILEIELFTQEHYKQSIEPEENLSELYKDIFLFHWKEETTHAMMNELEWPREDSKLSAEERDRAIDELIAIVADVDGILQNQSAADVDYFTQICDRSFIDDEVQRIKDAVHRCLSRPSAGRVGGVAIHPVLGDINIQGRKIDRAELVQRIENFAEFVGFVSFFTLLHDAIESLQNPAINQGEIRIVYRVFFGIEIIEVRQ